MKAKDERIPNENPVEASPPRSAEGSETAGQPTVGVDRLKELEQKVAALEDGLLRAKADFQNLQKRALRERSDAIVYGNADLMKSLLGVVDDFERSMQALDGGAEPATILQGVRLVHENLRKVLADQGLEEIPAKGRAFDPSFHEALLHQPTKEHAAGTVMDVVARGYRLRDRVIRPARVVVAKAIEAGAGGTSGTRAGESAVGEPEPIAKE